MNREEILEKIEEYENMLDDIDEAQEEIDELRKQAKKSAIAIKSYLERDLAIELLKLGVANQK